MYGDLWLLLLSSALVLEQVWYKLGSTFEHRVTKSNTVNRRKSNVPSCQRMVRFCLSSQLCLPLKG